MFRVLKVGDKKGKKKKKEVRNAELAKKIKNSPRKTCHWSKVFAKSIRYVVETNAVGDDPVSMISTLNNDVQRITHPSRCSYWSACIIFKNVMNDQTNFRQPLWVLSTTSSHYIMYASREELNQDRIERNEKKRIQRKNKPSRWLLTRNPSHPQIEW